jgi:hypothetical protein
MEFSRKWGIYLKNPVSWIWRVLDRNACNVYLLVLSSWKVNIAKKSIVVMEL